MLIPKGTYVRIGGPKGQWISPRDKGVKAKLLSAFVSQDMTEVLSDLNKQDLTILADLMQAGKVTPVIERRYKLSEVPEAIRYVEEGHARGKVVITLE